MPNKIKKMNKNKIKKVQRVELGYIVNNHTYIPNIRVGGQQDASAEDIEHMLTVEEWLDDPETEEWIAPTMQAIQALGYLADTDWYVLRFLEDGTPIPQIIVDNRALAKLDAVQAPAMYIPGDVLDPIEDDDII